MSDDALAVHDSDVEGVRLVEAFGELDLATAPQLCAHLDAARRERIRRLVVDLTGVAFCDSTGLRALIGASQELRVASEGQRRIDYVAGLYFLWQDIQAEATNIYGSQAAAWFLPPATDPVVVVSITRLRNYVSRIDS